MVNDDVVVDREDVSIRLVERVGTVKSLDDDDDDDDEVENENDDDEVEEVEVDDDDVGRGGDNGVDDKGNNDVP